MTVLTENDWNTIQTALQRMEHIELERTLVPKNVRQHSHELLKAGGQHWVSLKNQ